MFRLLQSMHMAAQHHLLLVVELSLYMYLMHQLIWSTLYQLPAQIRLVFHGVTVLQMEAQLILITKFTMTKATQPSY